MQTLFIFNSTGLPVADGQLHHLCVTWESSSGDFKVYRDGALVKTLVHVETGMQIKGDGIWVIGQDQDSLGGGFQAQNSFKGILTEVNIWNRILGSDEITNFANDCGSLVQGNYKAYSDFNITSATELIKPSCCPLAPLPEA
jgi:CUB/sushi domain-containing protein